ncbi:hypothetical protein GUI04_07400, partial [Xanthomonas citri pv. citri]|nr:hypothetical protein [Xanthomonas citri pv. citri]
APQRFTGDCGDPNITSFYISNLPGDATKAEIWKLFARFGKLVDVYSRQEGRCWRLFWICPV